MGTIDWVAIGTMATAAFTGISAWMIWRNRARTKLMIDPVAFGTGSFTRPEAMLSFAVRNLGTTPVIGVRVFRVRPGVGAKPLTERIAALPPGDSIDLTVRYAIELDVPYELNEETGEYPAYSPEWANFGDDTIEVIYLRPPKLKRQTTLTAPVHTLREDLRATYE